MWAQMDPHIPYLGERSAGHGLSEEEQNVFPPRLPRVRRPGKRVSALLYPEWGMEWP
jgi:hypothetical protein